MFRNLCKFFQKDKSPYVAIKVRELSKRKWHAGSALYMVSPPVEYNDGGFITETSYIIVAHTPVSKVPWQADQETIDAWTGPLDGALHGFLDGPPETTCFAAKSNGSLYNQDYANDEYIQCRVNGYGAKAEESLAKLQGGYTIVTDKNYFVKSQNLFEKRFGRLPLDHPHQRKIERMAMKELI